jgi:SpoVK/Ycf46/Vps4 family AAA+-type ATPase
MCNQELVEVWTDLAERTPCFVVIEDVDAVFEGRKNIVENSDLTFDCLLNVMDGVGRGDGIVSFVTTNHPERLDPALGATEKSAGEVGARPGRIDRSICFTVPDDAGRRQIIERIVRDDVDAVSRLVAQTAGHSGAQVQELATRWALGAFWGAPLRGSPAFGRGQAHGQVGDDALARARDDSDVANLRVPAREVEDARVATGAGEAPRGPAATPAEAGWPPDHEAPGESRTRRLRRTQLRS